MSNQQDIAVTVASLWELTFSVGGDAFLQSLLCFCFELRRAHVIEWLSLCDEAAFLSSDVSDSFTHVIMSMGGLTAAKTDAALHVLRVSGEVSTTEAHSFATVVSSRETNALSQADNKGSVIE